MKSDHIYIKTWLLLLLAILVFLIDQLPFLVDMRPVMYDEAWYGDTAYNFATGHGFRNVIVGSRGNSNFLLPLLTAGFMRVFGYNLLAIRLTAVLSGVVTLFFLWLSMKRMKVEGKAMALTFLFFVSTTAYNTLFRFGRPECLAMMCMAGGLWFCLRYRESHSWGDMLGLSAFVLMAGCAHPYALLYFALIGVYLFVKYVKEKNWKGVFQLMVLLMAALASVAAVAYVSKVYNGEAENYVSERFSLKGIAEAVPVYFKRAFLSKYLVYMLPLSAILVYEAWKDKENKVLAVLGLVHLGLFPVFFSTDLEMVDLGLDYVVYVATLLMAPFLSRLTRRYWRILFLCYCLGSLGLSYYYNFGVKYERANSVLGVELPTVVPKGEKVFGPIRQWPMLMETCYQSDHKSNPIHDIDDYDYYVLNTQDTAFFRSYRVFLPYVGSRLELVYERQTRQYGTVQVYRNLK